jgi:hypothetical protein
LHGALFVRREQELVDELESHIEMQTEENLRAGMSPEEARRAAALKFGSLQSVLESYRDQRGLPFVESVLSDLRYAVRGLRKNPAFTLTVLTTLAIGIAASTAIFSVLDALLLKRLPVENPADPAAQSRLFPCVRPWRIRHDASERKRRHRSVRKCAGEPCVGRVL